MLSLGAGINRLLFWLLEGSDKCLVVCEYEDFSVTAISNDEIWDNEKTV